MRVLEVRLPADETVRVLIEGSQETCTKRFVDGDDAQRSYVDRETRSRLTVARLRAAPGRPLADQLDDPTLETTVVTMWHGGNEAPTAMSDAHGAVTVRVGGEDLRAPLLRDGTTSVIGPVAVPGAALGLAMTVTVRIVMRHVAVRDRVILDAVDIAAYLQGRQDLLDRWPDRRAR